MKEKNRKIGTSNSFWSLLQKITYRIIFWFKKNTGRHFPALSRTSACSNTKR